MKPGGAVRLLLLVALDLALVTVLIVLAGEVFRIVGG